MSIIATADAQDVAAELPPLRVSIESVRCALLWLTGFSGAFVFIEPSPYEVMSLFTATVFMVGGLTLQAALIPLLALLFFYNLGFWIAVIPVINEEKTLSWVLISAYLSVTAIFFAAMLAKSTERRLTALCRGYMLGAVVAALAGAVGFFNVVPQLSDLFMLYERARGTFNDPNVLGAFLIFPAMLALQKLYSGRFFSFLGGGLMVGLFTAAVLLSFSRGAWGQLAFSALVMTALLFMTSRSPRQRLRIALFAIMAVIALAGVVALLFSVESISDMFRQRASFEQSYDTGHFGRFGRYTLGFDLALDKPFGIGPFQFRKYFVEDAHDVFLNSFMAGGWLSGFCYFTLIVVTLLNGLRYVAVDTPWRPIYLAVYAVFLGIVAESVIIDSDHWRHFFLLLGVQWGLMIATRRWLTDTAELAAEIDGEPEPISDYSVELVPVPLADYVSGPSAEAPPDVVPETVPEPAAQAVLESSVGATQETDAATAVESSPEAAPDPTPTLVPETLPQTLPEPSPALVPENPPEKLSEPSPEPIEPSAKPAESLQTISNRNASAASQTSPAIHNAQNTAAEP
jgi:hypothetical protein